MPRYFRFVASIAAIGLGATALAACTPVESGDGSDFPADDIRLVIQADAGGGSDLSSRALAAELEKSLDVSVIPENMPGASGAKAMEYIAAQDPDGYTIGFAPVEIAMLNTTQNADVLPENYDFLGQIMNAPGVIAVSASSDIETLDDLIQKAKDGEVTISNSGAGSIWEAASLGLAEAAGVEITPVPYDGGAPAVSAAASGETVASVSGVGEAIAQKDSVRVLAVMDDERHPDLPDVPTANEELGADDVVFGGWGGIYAPAGLPDGIHDKLEEAVKAAVESDSYTSFQEDAGNLVVYRSADEHQTFVEEQFDRFKGLLG
ncbi:MAG: tripartite tricarboxylate transporter substrate binding protein [Microbacterium gubbeenense]|uniref:tripartite tricarboxylate transporter substrate binding protein n=2 Tax=Microbacterium gubbeenense TaxID=159896 RepID=UPI003F972BEA